MATDYEEKYLIAMAEEQARLDPENMADEIYNLKALVKTLTERVTQLENQINEEEPVHASALCEAQTCWNCGACEDYRINGGRI